MTTSGDVAAVFRSAMGRGTNFDIAATDHIRPIATTMASPMNVRIVHPLCRLSLATRVSHISRRKNVKRVTYGECFAALALDGYGIEYPFEKAPPAFANGAQVYAWI